MVETPNHSPLPTGRRPALFVLAGLAGFGLIAAVALRDRLTGSEHDAAPPARLADPLPGAAPPRSPSFDVVRVSPAGDMVMAGRAAPGAEVIILQGGREIGRTHADERGEWIFLPSAPLAAGALTLTLRERTIDGQEIAGDGSVALVAPDRAGSAALATARLPQAPAVVGSGPAGATPVPGDKTPIVPADRVADGQVVVEPGQSLWRLARRAYGGGPSFTVIYQANRDHIQNPDLIYPGQVLAMPAAKPPAAGP